MPGTRIFKPALVALLVAAAWGAFLLQTGPARAQDASVSIAGLAFQPASVTVSVGDTVTWTNNDMGVPHTATSDTAGVFDSGNLNDGQTFSQTFSTAGTFTYHCNIHPNMTGTVVVQAAASQATATTATGGGSTPQATAQAPRTGTGTATTGNGGAPFEVLVFGAVALAFAATGAMYLASRRTR